MLVDIDLLKELRNKILVERVGYAFFVEVEYERLLDFCSLCSCIGHTLENYKRYMQDKVKVRAKANEDLRKTYADKQKEQLHEVVDMVNKEKSVDLPCKGHPRGNDGKSSGVDKKTLPFIIVYEMLDTSSSLETRFMDATIEDERVL